MPTYTTQRLQTEGLEPALQLLLSGVSKGRRVPYGKVADHLERKLGIPRVFPTHIGGVAGALMSRIWEVDEDAPPINLLVVNGDDWEPGSGGDGFLKVWFGLSASELRRHREEHVQAAINEVRAFKRWPEVYRKLFGKDYAPDPALQASDKFEADGQPDNPAYGRGGPESEEHRKLKVFVCNNPGKVGVRGAVASARVEARLLSGDEMDVEFLVGSSRWGVEVKSVRSGDADLERGIYQCVKYRAVMIAESGFASEEANCRVLLVTERQLPSSLAGLARRLGVKQLTVQVNTGGRKTASKQLADVG